MKWQHLAARLPRFSLATGGRILAGLRAGWPISWPGSSGLDIRRLLSVLSAAVADTETQGQANAQGDRQDKVFAAFDRAIELSEQGDLAGAEAQYRESLRLDPSFFPARVNLGILLAEMRRWAEAEAMYREVLRQDPGPPTDSMVLTNLGQLLMDSGRDSEAEAAFRESLRLDPDDTQARDSLNRILNARKH